MKKQKALEYIDFRTAIDTAKTVNKESERIIALNNIIIEKLEEEIKQYPAPTDEELKKAGEKETIPYAG